MTVDSVTTVQRHALERALVDDTDARRYFALAGALEEARVAPPSANGERAGDARSHPAVTEADYDGVLSAALLALAVVPHLVESITQPSEPPTVSPDPWQPDGDATGHAVRRGATLALEWFDVSPERVAARARIPRADLVSSAE